MTVRVYAIRPQSPFPIYGNNRNLGDKKDGKKKRLYTNNWAL